MNKITVKLKGNHDRSYGIYIGNGIFKKTPEFLLEGGFARRYAIISDSNVAPLYGRRLLALMNQAGIPACLLSFKAGEKNKTLVTTEKLLDALLRHRFNRKDAIIALGGGITGDVAGFVASIYMRGIPIIQIPTTLLAMVDASIGGKTGVNLTIGKNLAGTFHQPRAVIIDPELIKSLSVEEILNGFAEIIKYGVIANGQLFRLLEKEAKAPKNLSPQILNKIITLCCKIKASITEKDEKESSLRMILNLGHTSGHAIEKLTDYKISHGRAISIGMVLANEIGVLTHLLNIKDRQRINNLLDYYGLSTDFRKIFKEKKSAEKLWAIMQSDKKVQESKINFIIPKSIGKTVIYDKVNKKIFLLAFENMSK